MSTANPNRRYLGHQPIDKASPSVILHRPYWGVRWIRFDPCSRFRLPSLPCCYVVFDALDALLYVGQTTNLNNRFRTYKQDKTFPAGSYIKACFGERYGDWAMRELRLIKRLRPPMNSRIV